IEAAHQNIFEQIGGRKFGEELLVSIRITFYGEVVDRGGEERAVQVTRFLGQVGGRIHSVRFRRVRCQWIAKKRLSGVSARSASSNAPASGRGTSERRLTPPDIK